VVLAVESTFNETATRGQVPPGLRVGNITGSWTNNATHTINVSNQNLTVGGNLTLSDGTNSHAINVIDFIVGPFPTAGLPNPGGEPRAARIAVARASLDDISRPAPKRRAL
jgi:hypothetical protein